MRTGSFTKESYVACRHMGLRGEGENSTDVNLSAHIPNRNALLHTSHYPSNCRERTCSTFWSVCYKNPFPSHRTMIKKVSMMLSLSVCNNSS